MNYDYKITISMTISIMKYTLQYIYDCFIACNYSQICISHPIPCEYTYHVYPCIARIMYILVYNVYPCIARIMYILV